MPTITLVGISSKICTHIHTKSYTWIFKAVLFTRAKTWKQQRCPSVFVSIHLQQVNGKLTVVPLDKGILFNTKKKSALKS